jgi:hypothetical protein
MCNRAGSLIANVIESYGIPTVCLSINREMSESVRAPRAGFVKFPYGAPFGEPGAARQQMKVLYDILGVLRRADAHGYLVDLPHQWRRTVYAELAPAAFAAL